MAPQHRDAVENYSTAGSEAFNTHTDWQLAELAHVGHRQQEVSSHGRHSGQDLNKTKVIQGNNKRKNKSVGSGMLKRC